MAEFTIDPEFRDLLPRLPIEDYQRLADDIHANGCRDKLVVWKEHNILLDGHSRHGICRTAGLPFETMELSFASRNDAMMWMFTNQLARRNLTDFQRAEIALRMKPVVESQAKTRMSGRPMKAEVRQQPRSIDEIRSAQTREIIGKAAHLSGRTIDKVEAILQSNDRGVIASARNGEMSIQKAFTTVRPLVRKTVEQRQELAVLLGEVHQACDRFRRDFGHTRLAALASALHEEAIETRQLLAEVTSV